MAKVIEVGDKLILTLSRWEKFFGFHKDISALKSNLLSKKTVENPWSREVLKGVRSPGTGIPFKILLGSMRYKGGKDFTAIYNRKPVEVYEFKNETFKRWIITK